ncbi:MAG: site-specific DNA-methyltransferase [Armatimonadota bacterium]|nr:site-specific DNA-methyltransferase [Armatimonadota bacterium]
MKNNPLPRLDTNQEMRDELLPFCRLKPGDIWVDPKERHRIACIDATDYEAVQQLMRGDLAHLAIQDPPYNLVAFEERHIHEFIEWCERWVRHSSLVLAPDSSFYVWLGADQNNAFQPLPDFMIMMRKFNEFASRSFITMRNQRGYGTQHNWMAVRQELLYYIKGNPCFQVQYTEIPKILRGYYKEINGRTTENMERGKSENIRAGNVWVDVQQVFYRMEENVSGCYAQKPLKSIERIVLASSGRDDIVVDFFAHSGATLLACERLSRRCYTADIDPVYCEITIRRLERYRQFGRTGWQNGHPFEDEFDGALNHAASTRYAESTALTSQTTLF